LLDFHSFALGRFSERRGKAANHLSIIVTYEIRSQA